MSTRAAAAAKARATATATATAPAAVLVSAARPYRFVGCADVIGCDDWSDEPEVYPDGEVKAMMWVHTAGDKSTWRMCWNPADNGNFGDNAILRWAGKEGPEWVVAKGGGSDTWVDGVWGDGQAYTVR